jgi:hypothetical protein
MARGVVAALLHHLAIKKAPTLGIGAFHTTRGKKKVACCCGDEGDNQQTLAEQKVTGGTV